MHRLQSVTTPLCAFVIVTATPGMTAPDESVTVPRISPAFEFCACNEGAAILPSTSAGGGSGVQIEGVQAYQTSFLINGGGAVLPASQNITRPTLFDAISEVQALSSNFSAEYGNGSSVINVITKSGTNQWHGSLYEFNQNDFINARNYFLPQDQPNTRVRWNLYGGSVGGPVLRNKLFFFAYQRNPTGNQELEELTVPNAAVRSGDFSDPHSAQSTTLTH